MVTLYYMYLDTGSKFKDLSRFEYERVSWLSAGVNLLRDYLNDHEVQIYFEGNNIEPL